MMIVQENIRAVLDAHAAQVSEVLRGTKLAAAKRRAALDFVTRQFHVLPVNDEKKPYTRLVPHGFKDATRDPDVVEKWFKAAPNANIAIACGQDYGLFVIDVDVKNGVPGKESLRKLLKERCPTLIAKTPSGGFHFYYKHPRIPLIARHPKFPGIDFKGADGGGYVLAPPSELSNGLYAWLNEAPIAELPASIIEELRKTSVPNSSENKSPARAVDWSELGARVSIPEGGRNNALTSIAGSMRHIGLTPAAVTAALIEQNESVCDPPLPLDEVRRIAASSAKWQSGKEAETKPHAIILTPLSRDWLAIQPPAQEFTWNPWLPLGSAALLVGEGAVGKSHLLLRIAAHVAAGLPLFGSDVQAGRAVYLGLEDPQAVLRRRIYSLNKAMCQQFDETVTDSLEKNLVLMALVGQQLNFLTQNGGVVTRSASVDNLVQSIGTARLVVIDPLSRLHGCEENSNSVSTAIVSCCEHIAQKTGAAVLLGHHTGKAAAREGLTDAYAARGGSGLADAARSVLRLIVATDTDAKGLNLDRSALERKEYLRLVHAKSSYARSAAPEWLMRLSTGHLEAFQPTQALPANHQDLIGRMRDWWTTQWGQQPFSRDTIRRQYKAIFGDDFRREKAEAVLDRAVDEGALERVGGDKNPQAKRFSFRGKAIAPSSAAVSSRDTGRPADTGQEVSPVSVKAEGEKDGGGEKTRRGLSPNRRRRVSNSELSSASAGTAEGATSAPDRSESHNKPFTGLENHLLAQLEDCPSDRPDRRRSR